MYKDILKKGLPTAESENGKDLFTLGLHLHLEHGCKNPKDFDKFLKFAFTGSCEPHKYKR